jgi:hypothetical protein
MSRTQRIALLGVAAIIAVLAIVVLPGDYDEPTPTASTQPAQQARSTPAEPAGDGAEQTRATQAAPASKPKRKPPLLRAGTERELEFTKGETVRFRVRHPSAEEVHVHGYDISRDLQPGKTATVSFKAELEGIFEIELEQSGTPIVSLKVEPK